MSDMTPVERLRAAEVLLRERAEAYKEARDRQSIGAMIVANEALDAIGFHDPAVALAVAEVLRHTADAWEATEAAGKVFARGRIDIILALADALLGGGGA